MVVVAVAVLIQDQMAAALVALEAEEEEALIKDLAALAEQAAEHLAAMEGHQEMYLVS